MSDNLFPSPNRRTWIARLASKDNAVREAEIDATVAIGEPAVPVLFALIKDHWAATRAKEAAIAALGRIGGKEAADCLLACIARQEKDALFRRRWCPAIFGALAILILAAVLIPLFAGGRPVFNGGMVAPIVTITAITAQALVLRKGFANALGALKEPRAIGPLALAATEKKMAPTALPILTELLPNATEEHVSTLGPPERAALIQLLGQPDPDIVRSALRVVAMFGGEDAREPVERILRQGPAIARADAERALAMIRGRIETQRDRETLLRASSSVDGIPADELLRPAAAQPDPQPDQLLRRTDAPLE